ncbi:AAA family ATPase (plasmid) [Pseudomonas aeruginosa]|uniref:AAA family ATPase n=1 Tax=Pseudomonas TaxID=286 RepID=UPI0018D5B850|nr:AAA family ATPase [Pseudomonas putida]MBH3416066.1 AAA family ATPase [Pseudomonas putida]MDG9814395.1 AAA family ATPase [Pseudomonas putida]
MINEIEFEGRVIKLHDDNVAALKNTFTIIVGKNGSGKSRFLRKLTQSCVQALVGSKETTGLMDGAKLPGNVIAVSTSPFDRFPMPEYSSIMLMDERHVIDAKGYYFYQGLRGLYGVNLSVAFMVQIIGAVIKALMVNEERVRTILDVLDYLGFERLMSVSLACDFTRPTLERLATKVGFDEYATGARRPSNEVKRLMARLGNESPDCVEKVIEAIGYYNAVCGDKKIDILITENGIDTLRGIIDERFVMLMECGVLKFKLLSLRKQGVQKPVRISDASSGEQCVVMTMLGIAARIKHGSLICIDEPEICLHPEWQERYIQLLMSTFQGFQSCQFVVATHSPQIVSRLGNENCYVLDLKSNSLQRAEVFNNRSVDFQLAQVFNAPGFKNEYLMRELLGIVGALSSGKELSRSQQDFMGGAKALKSSFSSNDPVLQLVKLVEDALKVQEAQGE